jgi:hypothetical protein
MQGKRKTEIREFENRVLSRTCGPTNGKMEKWHSKKFHSELIYLFKIYLRCCQ